MILIFQFTTISQFPSANRHRRETNCSQRTKRRFEVEVERQILQVRTIIITIFLSFLCRRCFSFHFLFGFALTHPLLSALVFVFIFILRLYDDSPPNNPQLKTIRIIRDCLHRGEQTSWWWWWWELKFEEIKKYKNSIVSFVFTAQNRVMNDLAFWSSKVNVLKKKFSFEIQDNLRVTHRICRVGLTVTLMQNCRFGTHHELWEIKGWEQDHDQKVKKLAFYSLEKLFFLFRVMWDVHCVCRVCCCFYQTQKITFIEQKSKHNVRELRINLHKNVDLLSFIIFRFLF